RDALRARLLALADRAGARVLGAYEWGLGDKTKKANAALAGLGGTRRILVSDTMLAEYSDDEIEVVLRTRSRTTSTATSGSPSASRARWSWPASFWRPRR